MEITTRGGNQTIDPHMSYVVDDDVRNKDDVVEDRGELEDAITKEV